MTVLSMKDPYGDGHIVYYYVGLEIYMHVIRPINNDYINRKTVWSDYAEIKETYGYMKFGEKSIKWARLRGIDV